MDQMRRCWLPMPTSIWVSPDDASSMALAVLESMPILNPLRIHQRAAWISGQKAAWALGRTEQLDKASAASRGPQKDALKALAAVQRGDVATARLQFPPSGLQGADAAVIYKVAALVDGVNANQWYDKAIVGADGSGIDLLPSTRGWPRKVICGPSIGGGGCVAS